LAGKYAAIFVHGRYLIQEADTLLEEICELQGTDNVQGQIFEHIFKVKWRLLCLLSFKYFLELAQFRKLGNILDIPQFQLGIFGHVTRLGQLCSS